MKECVICNAELPLPMLNSKGQFMKGSSYSKYCSDECLDNKFSCNLCNKSFRHRRYYESHIFRCQLKVCVCENTFYTTHPLYVFCSKKCKVETDRIANITCSHCEYKGKDKHDVERHFKSQHNKLSCKYCKKTYTKYDGGGMTYCSPKCSFDLWRNKPKNKLNFSMQMAVRRGMKHQIKNSKYFKYLSFTMEELRTHLESQFKDWMNWNNHGLWHIDHIKPVASFNFTSMEDEEFKKCWSLENLRPLKDTENMRKNHYYFKKKEEE